MTELEHIEIDGFKGLEYVEFEPTDINVITGRNNTGKTSLLEAIDLLFCPVDIGRFEDNVTRTIHISDNNATINGESADNRTKLTIRRLLDGEISHYFIQVVSNLAYDHSGPYKFLIEGDDKLEKEQMDMIEATTRDILDNHLEDEEIQKIRNDFVIIALNGRGYPYFSSGSKSEEILSILSSEIANKFEDEGVEIVKDMHGMNEETVKELASQAGLDVDGLWRSVAPRIQVRNVHGFINPPNTEGSANFIESAGLTGNIEIEDDEKDPIKIDNIGDFIKAKEFVDDLKTFDIDYLVFEKEDGEKYQIPYDFMGDGFKSIVGLLWELLDKKNKNKIVLIEEPENHMHPGYVSELVHFLIDLARDEDIQFFITTHDHDFIKDFFMDMPDEKREYLEEEFSLVKMDDFGADVLNYEDAEHHLKDLHLDLRGI